MWTFITIVAAALLLFVLIVWAAASLERRRFVSGVNADEAARLRGFCIGGGSWREFATLVAAERGQYRHW
jgi:hypothetical protein